jgi:iron complex transport system substrate-binding protein
MTLLGQIFGEEDRAHTYIKYFDYTVSRVGAIVNTIPDDERTRILYGSLSDLSNPHLISEWWLSAAGGKSVTADIHTDTTTESVTFDLEELIGWDPQVIILSTESDIGLAYTDSRFSVISAVKNEKIYMCPRGVHRWGKS